MIPTVPFALIFSVFIGLLFAACARAQLGAGASPFGRELWAVLGFEAIIVWPVALYFSWVHPDWSWMYFIDPRRLPRGASLLLLLGFAVALLGGYLGGWALLRRGGARALFAALGAVGLVGVLGLVLFRQRIAHAGSLAEFHAGHALPLGAVKLGWALGATAIGVGLAIALTGLSLWEQGKRSRS